MTGFQWDPQKNAVNEIKHGLSFEQGAQIFRRPTVEKEDGRKDYGETRIIAYGQDAEGTVLAVVYTPRNDDRRIISVRRASSHEREAYDRALRQP